jgi:hypothetical protein
MPHPRITAALLCALALSATAEKPRKPTPPAAAQSYAMHQTIAGVTIAAEPGDTKDTRPDTRLDYFSRGILPIRVIVTNDTELPITLDDARIHLVTADNSVLQAATLDDLQRRMFTIKSATGSKVPLPLPVPIPITMGKKNIDKKITDDDHDFSFQNTTVAPHATVAGYLFYDIQNVDAPALDHAALELKKVRIATTQQALDTYEIPLRPAKN